MYICIYIYISTYIYSLSLKYSYHIYYIMKYKGAATCLTQPGAKAANLRWLGNLKAPLQPVRGMPIISGLAKTEWPSLSVHSANLKHCSRLHFKGRERRCIYERRVHSYVATPLAPHGSAWQYCACTGWQPTSRCKLCGRDVESCNGQICSKGRPLSNGMDQGYSARGMPSCWD